MCQPSACLGTERHLHNEEQPTRERKSEYLHHFIHNLSESESRAARGVRACVAASFAQAT